MGISTYNIKKWYKMVKGTSVLHVNQSMGTCFVPGQINGYFNNLTEKVVKEPELLESESLPLYHTEKNGEVEFPVAIFQYGLGAYDLFLKTQDPKYLRKFMQCVDWAMNQQQDSGAWDSLSFLYPDYPYSAMCQGEGASLLIRAFKQTGDQKYMTAAQKALDFMLEPVEKGGTTKCSGKDVILMEYVQMPTVLNGWIFAAFGLYDMSLESPNSKYGEAFSATIETMKNQLDLFDNGYWSKYDADKKITSPFYHNLHIAQMEALYLVTEDKAFKEREEKWRFYQSKWWNRKRAFIKKAWQKIKE